MSHSLPTNINTTHEEILATPLKKYWALVCTGHMFLFNGMGVQDVYFPDGITLFHDM